MIQYGKRGSNNAFLTVSAKTRGTKRKAPEALVAAGIKQKRGQVYCRNIGNILSVSHLSHYCVMLQLLFGTLLDFFSSDQRFEQIFFYYNCFGGFYIMQVFILCRCFVELLTCSHSFEGQGMGTYILFKLPFYVVLFNIEAQQKSQHKISFHKLPHANEHQIK